MYNLPPAFTERMHLLLKDEAEAFFQALQQPSPVSIRLNPKKLAHPDFSDEVLKHPVNWCKDGYYLTKRPIFTLDPYFHGGAYYVQEASSMFLSYILGQIMPSVPVKALDLCAAPGGKSTLLAASLPNGSLLIANEVIRSRAAILKENTIKWGHDNMIVSNNDPADFKAFKGAFDIVMVDAPCSGEGMFRKDPASIGEWSGNNLRICNERQKRILTDIWDTLKPEGYLIYSTCTYNPGENEEILEWLHSEFNARSIEIHHPFDSITPGNSTYPCYRFYPHKTEGEGFFICILQKTEGEEFKIKKSKTNPTFRLPAELNRFLPENSPLTARNEENRIIILPAAWDEFIRYSEQNLHIIYKGCEIAELNNKKAKPLHPLALYTQLNKANCNCFGTDLNTALRFLKKEDIPVNAPAGDWILITYHECGIGWGKSLGNRFNNYFPKEWRIRMDIPSDILE